MVIRQFFKDKVSNGCKHKLRFLNHLKIWYAFQQQTLPNLDGEGVRRKKKRIVLMILMFLHNVTNNSVLKCLKMPHVKTT